MKKLTTLCLLLFSILAFSQSENKEGIIINDIQQDDKYLADEKIQVNAAVQGDLVIAGGNLIVKDSIHGDLIAAGGELSVEGYVMDDVRIAGGKVTIDSEIGDDLVVFGGEVLLSENARIHGQLLCYAGDITMNGEVMERLKVRGGDVSINGTVRGPAKLVGEELTIGSNAKFHGNVEYWNDDGEMDFQNSLVNGKAQFNEELSKENSQSSLTTLGTASIKLWIFYILSAFLVILVLHALFRNAFSNAVEGLKDNWLKSFGFGLIYLIGIPLLILLAFLMLIGIPLGLFATVIFIFSLLFGHLVASLLVTYYLKERNGKNWGFWSITFLALLIAIVLRLFTIIPYAGVLVSIVILSITYGALTLKVLQSKKQLAKT
ncbi:polymer-forming cytoskeletal protein [Aureisphaera galaxeae]|uniref:polymer-forming cytoskeletal protein n=1 Tax=Aureisphaera galaxeae TaxID=1538023 RepID=UPI0023506B92|nr:polymer-forming cytoskeletal protein [Aureisphaera galaxeae]MDC8006157.1 polymer-forming cytoskeletal protein [Aureisphaera galaxeae]